MPLPPIPKNKEESLASLAAKGVSDGIDRAWKVVVQLIFWAFSLGLIVSGCWAESESKSAIQQTVAAIQYCTGFALVALAILFERIRK